jgi:hypothetical protein
MKQAEHTSTSYVRTWIKVSQNSSFFSSLFPLQQPRSRRSCSTPVRTSAAHNSTIRAMQKQLPDHTVYIDLDTPKAFGYKRDPIFHDWGFCNYNQIQGVNTLACLNWDLIRKVNYHSSFKFRTADSTWMTNHQKHLLQCPQAARPGSEVT